MLKLLFVWPPGGRRNKLETLTGDEGDEANRFQPVEASCHRLTSHHSGTGHTGVWYLHCPWCAVYTWDILSTFTPSSSGDTWTVAANQKRKHDTMNVTNFSSLWISDHRVTGVMTSGLPAKLTIQLNDTKLDGSYWRSRAMFLMLRQQQAASRNNTLLERKHIKAAFLFECIKERSKVGLLPRRALSLWLIPPGCRKVQKELLKLSYLPLRCNTLFRLQSNTKVADCCFFCVFSLVDYTSVWT